MFCEYSIWFSKKYGEFVGEELLASQEGLIAMQKVNSR
jgi:hypothetical protein